MDKNDNNEENNISLSPLSVEEALKAAMEVEPEKEESEEEDDNS
jgi:hypothetical protein